jgi:hypothetical protein
MYCINPGGNSVQDKAEVSLWSRRWIVSRNQYKLKEEGRMQKWIGLMADCAWQQIITASKTKEL